MAFNTNFDISTTDQGVVFYKPSLKASSVDINLGAFQLKNKIEPKTKSVEQPKKFTAIVGGNEYGC